MRLFISYGHDIAPRAYRLARGLATQGHEIWIDSERLRQDHADWRRALAEALHHCEWTVGLMTRHVRDWLGNAIVLGPAVALMREPTISIHARNRA